MRRALVILPACLIGALVAMGGYGIQNGQLIPGVIMFGLGVSLFFAVIAYLLLR